MYAKGETDNAIINDAFILINKVPVWIFINESMIVAESSRSKLMLLIVDD